MTGRGPGADAGPDAGVDRTDRPAGTTAAPAASGAHDLLFTLIGRVGSMFIAIAMQVVLARVLGPDGRGSYEACLLFGSLMIVLCNFGSEMSSLYMISSKRIPVRTGFANGLSFAAALSLVALGLGLVLLRAPLSFLSGMLGKATPALFVLGLVAGQTQLVADTSLAMLPALQRFRMYSAVLLLGRASALVFLVFLIWLPGREVGGVLGAVTASRILQLLVVVGILYGGGALRWEKPRWRHQRELFVYGVRYYAGSLSNQVNFRLGAFVLALFATREELGFYGQAMAIALNYMVLPDSLFTVMIPRASADSRGRAEAVAQAGRMMLVVGVVALVGAHFLTVPVFRLLLTESFLPSAPLFRVLLLGFAVRAFGKMFEPYLIGTDRPGRLSMAVMLGVSVNLALVLLLMPRLGVVGAAWALVGNYAVSTAFIVAAYVRDSRMAVAACLVPRGEDLRLAASLATGLFRRGGRSS